MDILDILLDILLKPPQPFIGLFWKSVMASDIHIFMHILLPMMIRIFSWIYFSGGLANGTVTIFGTGMRHIRGVRSMDGHSVQMWAWNAKFWAQRVKVSCPTLHSISV